MQRAFVSSLILLVACAGSNDVAPPPPPPAGPADTVVVPQAPSAEPSATEPEAPPAPRKPRERERTKHTTFDLDGAALKLPGPIVFEVGSDKLKPESDEVLEIVRDYLQAKPEITLLRIEGHTDTAGAAAANQALSEKRSLAVARWLIGQGIDCRRLIAVGFGGTKPIADNATPEGKAQNRRTSFINAALRGKPIGGLPVDGGGMVSGDPCK